MALRKIRLELARNSAFPQGSPQRGYDLVAPLTADGHFDAAEWKTAKSHCRVRRFWEGEPDQEGLLVHRGGGWAFDYDRTRKDDDEPLFKLDRHRIVEGDYLTVTEHDGEQRTFRVAKVQ